MPPPIPVDLQPHSPAWAESVVREIQRIAPAFGENLVDIHHVGSTAIKDISAKPILDLIPVVRHLSELDRQQSALEKLGFEWWGEYGLPGRRYCTLADPVTSLRKVQLHCFEVGSAEIERHLAFRDYLNSHPLVAKTYDQLKARCRDLHPLDSHAYSDCKSDWIRSTEAEAIAFFRDASSA